ncbi:C13 family peptidase [Desulfonema magnum]|nr:C13 family peptidase [Desulfonema magnum]
MHFEKTHLMYMVLTIFFVFFSSLGMASAWESPAPMPKQDHQIMNDSYKVSGFTRASSVSKAIIVAGGGGTFDDTLWESTQMCANYAYRALLYRGYLKENIYYLSSDTSIDADDNGQPDDVDETATYQNLSDAINIWARRSDNPAHDLMIYMTGHGGNRILQIGSDEVIEARELDSWLDDLQKTMTGRLIFIYDASKSGTFLCKSNDDTGCSEPLMSPPEGKERIVITSASDESAYFMPMGRLPGGLSFSFQFWSGFYYGSELDDAFFFAKDMMEDFQTALLDANGNGIGNDYDDRKLADGIVPGKVRTDEDDPVGLTEPFTDYILDISKAIIVAGGGPYPGNNLWEDTMLCTNYAYDILIERGYSKENICYLSSDKDTDADGNGLSDDVYGDATYENLFQAINTWVKTPDAPVYELLIYITDHGGDGTFRLNPTETLKVEELDKWLDDLQETMPGRLIFIYDACQSGTFLCKTYDSNGRSPECLEPRMRPPEGKERIVITSASDESAYFMPMGKGAGGLSFSFQFWSHIDYGAKLDEAFFFAKDMMGDFQTALLDADGNGIGNEHNDMKLAESITIGKKYKVASDIPVIENVSETQTLQGESDATLWAGPVTDADGISEVWGVITPPGHSAGSADTPVLELPTVKLLDTDDDGIYEGAYEHFNMKGTYTVNIYAADTKDTSSLPKQTQIVQTRAKGADINGNGETDLGDAIMALKVITGISNSVPPLSEDSMALIDVNGDKKIGMEEAIYILRNLAASEPPDK